MAKQKPTGEEAAAAGAGTAPEQPTSTAPDAAAPAATAPASEPGPDPDASTDDDVEEPMPFPSRPTHNLKAPEGTCSIGVDDVIVKVPKDGIIKKTPHEIALELVTKHGFTAVE